MGQGTWGRCYTWVFYEGNKALQLMNCHAIMSSIKLKVKSSVATNLTYMWFLEDLQIRVWQNRIVTSKEAITLNTLV